MKQKNKLCCEIKHKDFWYCVFIVGLLIFLFLGDTIALRFISKNPNPNNTVFGNGQKEEYVIDFLQPLTIKEVLEKIDAKESFLLLSSRESCETCKLFLPDLKSTFEDYALQGYYMDKDLADSKEEDYLKFLASNESISKNFVYTPYFMFFEKGTLKGDLVGKVKKNELEDFVIRHRIAEMIER